MVTQHSRKIGEPSVSVIFFMYQLGEEFLPNPVFKFCYSFSMGTVRTAKAISDVFSQGGNDSKSHRSLAMNSSIGMACRVWIFTLPREPSSMET